jgi:hypothetical protein
MKMPAGRALAGKRAVFGQSERAGDYCSPSQELDRSHARESMPKRRTWCTVLPARGLLIDEELRFHWRLLR